MVNGGAARANDPHKSGSATVRVFVQAIQDRHRHVQEYLLPELERHGFPEVTVFTDYERRGHRWNATRIWEAIEEPTITLQDDVLLHPRFGDAVRVIGRHVEAGRMGAVSLFVPPRKVMLEYYGAGYTFVESYNFLWAQGLILSPSFTVGLLEFAPTVESRHDDAVMNRYCKETRNPVWTTLPSLVQHDLRIKSSIGTGTSCGGVRRETVVWDEELDPDSFSEVISVRYV